MEKQPIDDLFARKLRDAEAPVGSDVFSQLQTRMKTKTHPAKRPTLAWWHLASAACVVTVLGFLYIINSTDSAISLPIAVTKKVATKVNPLHPEPNKPSANVPERGAQRNRLPDSEVSKDEQLAQATYPAQKRVKPTIQSSAANNPARPIIKSVQRIAQAKLPEETQQLPNLNVPITVSALTRVAQSVERQPQTSERTIIMTIEEPLITNTQIASVSTISTPDSQLHQNSLSGLFGKIKQLKNGEALAKVASSANQNTPRNRFGRVFTEVKESLKNETTLE